ncbi:MAG: PilT/PilU family type 4a pilus ATPase [Candidatus Sumerlaeia bacterium]|nr:PilT/PilU family type 4a pilus ATPase [Candidatus Sumerlaeia bacterium]
MNFNALLIGAVQNGASDVHIIEGQLPYFRIRGDLKRVETPPLSHDDMVALLKQIMPDRYKSDLEANYGVDFSYQHETIARFRCVAYYQDSKLAVAMRNIPLKVPSIDDMHLPEVLKKIAMLHRGMVLVTGITGSGKSTTLASMLNHMNTLEARRIITIEDPIEFKYANVKSVISQREIGRDVADFPSALRQAMRADPDVILVGEMRDQQTIRIGIKAAETGHLVFSTLHTRGAVHTIQRIMGYFDLAEHDLLRDQLSLNLAAVITQRLVKTVDGKGRRAAQEIMIVNGIIKKLIREGRVLDIGGVMAGRDEGMQNMDQALAELVREKAISTDEGAKFCDDFYAMKRYIAGVSSSADKGGIVG